MTRRAAIQFICESEGKFFSVKFTKRTTGESRTMRCRTGVTKHLTGGGAKYSFSEKDLIPVYDMDKEAYRSIPLEGITDIMVKGEWEKVS